MHWQHKTSWIAAAAFALGLMAMPLVAAPAASATLGLRPAQQAQTTASTKAKKNKKSKKRNRKEAADEATGKASNATSTGKHKRSRSRKSAEEANNSAATASGDASSGAAMMAGREHGGAGRVWVNTQTGTFHYASSKYYGKTKQGKYMSESDAIKAGYHAAKNEKKPGGNQEK